MTMNNDFDVRAGFYRLDITPPLGVNLLGYYQQRLADGILDELEINAVAVEKERHTVIILAVDNIGIRTAFLNEARAAIAKELRIRESAIFIHSTHIHTGPMLNTEENLELDIEKEYSQIVFRKLIDCSKLAVADLRSAKTGIGESTAEHIGFNRRYCMKDGTVQTNPGVNNPNISKCIGLVDNGISVIRFCRESGEDIVIANYANHADTIGGTKISADWVGQARRTFERAIPNTRCMILNGAEGDINHINVFPKAGEFNGLKIDFDNVPRGYAHAVHMGNVIAGAIMQVYEKVNFIKTEKIRFITKIVNVPSNLPTTEELERAKYIYKMHIEGRDKELPYSGMQLTTVIAEAERVNALANGPEKMPMLISVLVIGNIAIVGFPGEPFSGIGIELKKTKGWDMIMPCCLVNGKEGYFPMIDSYNEGGYEAKCSRFKAGVAELLIEEAKKILNGFLKE